VRAWKKLFKDCDFRVLKALPRMAGPRGCCLKQQSSTVSFRLFQEELLEAEQQLICKRGLAGDAEDGSTEGLVE
jgi:hypothetical protein